MWEGQSWTIMVYPGLAYQGLLWTYILHLCVIVETIETSILGGNTFDLSNSLGKFPLLSSAQITSNQTTSYLALLKILQNLFLHFSSHEFLIRTSAGKIWSCLVHPPTLAHLSQHHFTFCKSTDHSILLISETVMSCLDKIIWWCVFDCLFMSKVCDAAAPR